MPEKVIKKFQDQYGKKKGKQVFYATAKKQDRDPETFHKKGKKTTKESFEEKLNRVLEEDATWTDFSLEDHIRAFIGVPPRHVLRFRETTPGIYRVNVINQGNGNILKSMLVKLVESQDGPPKLQDVTPPY